MLKVEYLIFIDNQNIKCSNNKTFNHLLQSNPDILIENNKLIYQGLVIDYDIKNGKAPNTENNYFHVTFICNELSNIDIFNSLIRAFRSILYVIAETPQILFDGISLHYTQLAYPKIYEIENLMRKLITKFMLTNVGIDWTKERVPEDVKNSINSNNKDLTYLHNVDFIQLKNFLFSENYPTHKENLLQKLKKAKNLNEINLEDIKTLIPISNWDKYFSEKVSITKDQLSNKWGELYELRCKIAHNRVFTHDDFKNTEKLYEELKGVLDSAISNLDTIDISDKDREIISEKIQFLIMKGELNGKLTYDEVISALPPGDDIDLMDKVFFRLSKSKIELVDSI